MASAPASVPAAVSPAGWRLLSRPGCHLCDEFSDELLTAFPSLSSLLKWVDVDSRDDWRARFGRTIPVLLDPSQQAVCETFFDRAAVAAALARNRVVE